MKKLYCIGKKIKNNNYSYTGKGAFESIVKNFKSEIIKWLEELVPLQKQIEYLDEKTNVEFQKRNYTRILTKLFPEEYKEFVSLNILIRDANEIAKYYSREFNLTTLYSILTKNKYLKYPGKYLRFVEFDIFQKFIITYRSELLESISDEINIIQEDTTQKQNKISQDNKENISQNTKTQTNWTNLLLGNK